MKGARKTKSGGYYALTAVVLTFLILLTALLILREAMKDRYKKETPRPATEQWRVPSRQQHEPAEYGKIFPSAGHPSVAIIIDDIGWNYEIVQSLKGLPFPVTLALLPESPFAEDIAKALQDNPNFQMLLHLPLEPKGSVKTDTGFLTTKMSDDEIRKRFDRYFAKFSPYVVGVNNHMGSLFTTNEDKMAVLLEEIKNKRLFFVDSCTAPGTVGYSEAKKLGVKTAKRDIFLDNDESKEKIALEIDNALRIAGAKGKAVAICHPHRVTIETLKEVIPRFERDGYRFVFVSKLVD
jgi:hypothetical protein